MAIKYKHNQPIKQPPTVFFWAIIAALATICVLIAIFRPDVMVCGIGRK